MTYRYNTIDIIVGVGMCAIVFGALLFFVAANGTFQAAIPPPISFEQPTGIQVGMTWLQPALGQAVVDQAIFERRTNQVMAQSASEWNRATLAHHELESMPGGPFGAVVRQAATVPTEHIARVQGVMGRAIVNFTRRGLRSGAFAADDNDSAYNAGMIRVTELRKQRLDHEFASTWQTVLGREIVDAFQTYTRRNEATQEQLGTAALHMTQAQMVLEEGGAAHQSQLASLVVAAIRTEALMDRLTLLAAIESLPDTTVVASTEPTSWPEMPMSYLIAAGLMLATIFFAGLSLTARSRETKALAEVRHYSGRWVYRLAA